MTQLFFRQHCFQISCARTAIQNNVIISFRNSCNRHTQEFCRFSAIRFRRVEGTKIFFLEPIVEFIHQILKPFIRFPGVWQNFPLEVFRFPNFAFNPDLPLIVS